MAKTKTKEIPFLTGLQEAAIRSMRKEIIKEVRKEEQLEMAKKLKKKGMSFEEISEVTGITKEEIEKL
mgnify:FL=1